MSFGWSAHLLSRYHVLESLTVVSDRYVSSERRLSARVVWEDILLSHDLCLKVGLDLRAISSSALDLADQRMCVFKMGGADRFDLAYIGNDPLLKDTRNCWKTLRRFAARKADLTDTKSTRETSSYLQAPQVKSLPWGPSSIEKGYL